MNFVNPPATGATRKWRVTSYFIDSSGFYYLRGDTGEFDHDNKCIIVPAGGGGGSADDLIWRDMYLPEQKTKSGEIGPINIHLNFPITFTIDNTYHIVVKIPKDFTP